VLEEALLAFPGVVCVVSHDRYFLNRVCTDILAFEGDGRIHHSVGDYDYYLEKKRRRGDTPSRRVMESMSAPAASGPSRGQGNAPAKPVRTAKLSFKQLRELEGIEPQILAAEEEIARIEGLFAAPDFHRTHATQTNELLAEVASGKKKVAELYARWAELEALRGQ
jgi:ATP-binding cassette subfamily F protein uup